MLSGSHLLYDEWIDGTGGIHFDTGSIRSDVFPSSDHIGIMVQFVLTSLTGSPSFSAQLQHSVDRVNWFNKNASAELFQNTFSTVGEQALWGGESFPTKPSHDFVRVHLDVTSPGTRLRVWVVGRGRKHRDAWRAGQLPPGHAFIHSSEVPKLSPVRSTSTKHHAAHNRDVVLAAFARFGRPDMTRYAASVIDRWRRSYEALPTERKR